MQCYRPPCKRYRIMTEQNREKSCDRPERGNYRDYVYFNISETLETQYRMRALLPRLYVLLGRTGQDLPCRPATTGSSRIASTASQVIPEAFLIVPLMGQRRLVAPSPACIETYRRVNTTRNATSFIMCSQNKPAAAARRDSHQRGRSSP